MAVRAPTARAGRVLETHGRTYAEEAGIRLRDAPSPLYRLLVLSSLMASPVPAATGVAAARELARRGWRTPSALLASTSSQRVEALREAGYRRFDEQTAARLAACAEAVGQEWHGDLRRLAGATRRDVVEVRRALERLPGVGGVASAIFCREVQGVWPWLAPFVDDRVVAGAQLLDLPTTPAALARLVEPDDLPRLVAACVRASLAGSSTRLPGRPGGRRPRE